MTTHEALGGAGTWQRGGSTRFRQRLGRLLCGPADQAAWARPALLGLLALTAVLYLWNLGASANANQFYAAAVLAGTKSWKAFFFGSFDAANFITVDKPPASLWVMEISGRLFGFSSWSMLVPQALEGVGAVAILHAAVRRHAGAAAGLFAATALAVTPVAALMFRFNNPDALLTLLLVAAAYAVVRATEVGSTRWLALAGSLVGLGVITKMLQAVIVLPVLALVYVVAAPPAPLRRIGQLLIALGVTVLSAGWWVAIVTVIPAADRPYIGGSTDNSVLDLAFGYNGLSRLTGNGTGGGVNFSGPAGILRLFGAEMGTQVSWLLPASLIGLLCGLWVTRSRPRRDHGRSALLLWGGWTVVTGLVFSLAGGIVHPYYAVALAPGIAATVAVSATLLWKRRASWFARIALAAMVTTTGIWSIVLLARAGDWHPELRVLVAAASAAGVAALLWGRPSSRRASLAAVCAAVVAGLAGPTAYAIQTAATTHSGGTPSAGPAAAVSDPAAAGGFAGAFRGGVPPTGLAGGPPPGFAGAPPPGLAAGAPLAGGGPPAGFGGGGVTTSAALLTLLRGAGTTWSAAAIGSQTAGALELSSGTAVMSIGGFTGADPTPSLAQFEQDVRAGRIGYFVAGGGGGGGGGRSAVGQQIGAWVAAHFAATSIGGQTVYKLTTPTSPIG